MDMNIGIDAKSREQIAGALSKVLADTYKLYMTTHNFHWNVKGPMFQTLHLMFEQQYNALWLAVDVVAERIRALGFPVPGEDGGVPKAEAMIRRLVEVHETTARAARDVFKLAAEINDQPTCDLLTQRMQVHEKTAWMLRSLVD